jgi:acyl-CoA reductase-like NAD-dependent aldehyde dehydrogenase
MSVSVKHGGSATTAALSGPPQLDVLLHVDGEWIAGTGGEVLPIVNPATQMQIGRVAKASMPDLERAVEAAARGFNAWKAFPPFERAHVLRRAGDLLRERARDIAAILTAEPGDPATISNYLIPHSVIRKVTFTGSVAVGKLLAGLAGSHMKRVTMELGGHAPVIVCDDADIDAAALALARFKFMNAGQVCLSATRFLIARPVYQAFVNRFADVTRSLKVGDGRLEDTYMGPLANRRRVKAMEEFVSDAVACGARVVCGGNSVGDRGFFFAPTVLAEVPVTARVMNEEPFGPIALMNPFETLDEAIEEANRLPYGLASFVFTNSLKNEAIVTERLEAAYKVPRIVEFVESLPKSGTGKIAWRLLQDRELNP